VPQGTALTVLDARAVDNHNRRVYEEIKVVKQGVDRVGLGTR
jgi:hypothetical protein